MSLCSDWVNFLDLIYCMQSSGSSVRVCPNMIPHRHALVGSTEFLWLRIPEITVGHLNYYIFSNTHLRCTKFISRITKKISFKLWVTQDILVFEKAIILHKTLTIFFR